MLYVSTRSRTDSFTAVRTLSEDYATDGGMFVPLRFSFYADDVLLGFKERSFGDNIAYVLNDFFNSDLSGWDIDSCVGRQPDKYVEMSHKLVVAELWHNHGSDYRYFEQAIYCMLRKNYSDRKNPTHWAKIAIRIAVLFAVWGKISSDDIKSIDISVSADDFDIPIAVWYAKKMGLPFCNIIFGCTDNSALWDLLYRGECSADSLNMADHVVAERILYDVFGLNEVQRFLKARNDTDPYVLGEEELRILSNEVYVSVLGSKRTSSIITSTFRSNQYIINSETAVSFGSLQNYRAQTGRSNLTLLLSHQTPLLNLKSLHQLLGLSEDEVRARVNHL